MGSELTTRDKSHTKPVKQLTASDRAFALRYHADGLTQVEIAQRLNCDQSTVSRWLSTCEDTTVQAGAYFRGQALPMARKVVRSGKPDVLLKALQGVGVIADADTRGSVTIIVGGSANVQVNIGAPRVDVSND